MSFHPLYAYEVDHCNHSAAIELPEHVACRPCVLAWHEQAAQQREVEARAAAFGEAAQIPRAMVVGGRAWNEGQQIAAEALFACAAAIEEAAKR